MPHEFKSELKHILTGPEEIELADVADPSSHGWLRRPEFDRDGLEVWERPDGSLRGVPFDIAGGPGTGP